ncbi:MAG TPA: response regulator [Gammaproteobacteria bacterium]|nr:response regulator [Gammaproteobacteria bacterium]
MADYQQVDILLVEDNPHDAEMTLRALRKINIDNTVVWVKDGEEALEFLYREGRHAGRGDRNPKLVLLDLKMPKVDGIEVLRRIKGDDRMKTIPVVMLTSSAEERDLVESYRLNVNSYIVKPVDFVKFMDEVSKIGFYWLLMNRVVS